MKNLIILTTILLNVVFSQESLPNVVALMPEGEQFQKVFNGIKDEVLEDFNLVQVILDEKNPDANIKAIEIAKPELVVLMENRSIRVIKKFQSKPENAQIPILATMVLQVENETQSLKNVAGIKFEIPAYTIFSNLKIASKTEFSKVGVFYNKDFQDFIDLSKKMVAKENIELVGYCVDCDGAKDAKKSAKYMSKVFKKKIRKKDNIDVMWMLPDNRLLNATTLKKFWVKYPQKKKMPLIVPIENLASVKANMGMMVFNPDYSELGVQAGSKIIEILLDETPIEEVGFEELLSVSPILNKKRAKKTKWKIDNDNLGNFKKVLD